MTTWISSFKNPSHTISSFSLDWIWRTFGIQSFVYSEYCFFVRCIIWKLSHTEGPSLHSVVCFQTHLILTQHRLLLLWPLPSSLIQAITDYTDTEYFPCVSAVVWVLHLRLSSGFSWFWRGLVIWAKSHFAAGEYPVLKNHLLGIIVLFPTQSGFKVKNHQNIDAWIISQFSIIVLTYVGLDNTIMLSSLLWPYSAGTVMPVALFSAQRLN